MLTIRDKESSISGSAEIEFALRLVRALGTRGPREKRYLAEYPTIAGALRELREERGLVNPRLMLQEANLLREWAMGQPSEPGRDNSAQLRALTEGANILATALSVASPSHASTLHVELASTLAAQSRALNGSPDVSRDQIQLFTAAREALRLARASDQASYYPVDVLAWATRDVIRTGLLDSASQAEVIVEVLDAFELIDPLELDPDQVVRFHQRRQEFAVLVGNTSVADDAFDALAEQRSGAGVYLRARAIADPASFGTHVSSAERGRAEQALDYLARFPDLVENDVRCLNLQFDLWWITHSGKRPFAGERTCLAFDTAEWRTAQDLIKRLGRAGQSYRELPLLFLQGLAEFHTQDFTAAFATFNEVERRSDEIRGRRRIVRSHLASTPEGRPVEYRGTVAWVSDDLRRGEVFVEQIRRKVSFIPREFGPRDFTPGTNLGQFHIGFNFLGVIADPLGYLHARRGAR